MTSILPGLFQGPESALCVKKSTSCAPAAGFTHVLSIGSKAAEKHVRGTNEVSGSKVPAAAVKHIGMRDDRYEDPSGGTLLNVLPECFNFIDASRQANVAVGVPRLTTVRCSSSSTQALRVSSTQSHLSTQLLVHCKAGISRSASVTAAYVLWQLHRIAAMGGLEAILAASDGDLSQAEEEPTSENAKQQHRHSALLEIDARFFEELAADDAQKMKNCANNKVPSSSSSVILALLEVTGATTAPENTTTNTNNAAAQRDEEQQEKSVEQVAQLAVELAIQYLRERTGRKAINPNPAFQAGLVAWYSDMLAALSTAKTLS